MVKELIDIVRENWCLIPPIILGVYGCVESFRGLYEIIKTETNQGIVEGVRGMIALGAAGISTPLLYKLSEYLQR